MSKVTRLVFGVFILLLFGNEKIPFNSKKIANGGGLEYFSYYLLEISIHYILNSIKDCSNNSHRLLFFPVVNNSL